METVSEDGSAINSSCMDRVSLRRLFQPRSLHRADEPRIWSTIRPSTRFSAAMSTVQTDDDTEGDVSGSHARHTSEVAREVGHSLVHPSLLYLHSGSRLFASSSPAVRPRGHTPSASQPEIIFTSSGVIVRSVGPGRAARDVERMIESRQDEERTRKEATQHGEVVINGNVYETNLYHLPSPFHRAASASLSSHLVSPVRRHGRSASTATRVPRAAVADEGETYFGVRRKRDDGVSTSAVDSIFGSDSSTLHSGTYTDASGRVVQLPPGKQFKLMSLQNSRFTHLRQLGGGQDIDVTQELHTHAAGGTVQVAERIEDRTRGVRRESVLVSHTNTGELV
jgi:hypothetical protein